MLKCTAMLFAGLLILSSCGSSNNSGGDDDNDMRDAIETISRGTMGGFSPGTDDRTQAGERVIRNAEEFNTLWQRMNTDIQRDEVEAPEIDFDTHMVVAVMMGEMPSSGYSIRVADLEEEEDHVEIRVIRIEPGPTCMNLTVITTPHHIVKIPRTEKELRYEYTTRVDECD